MASDSVTVRGATTGSVSGLGGEPMCEFEPSSSSAFCSLESPLFVGERATGVSEPTISGSFGASPVMELEPVFSSSSSKKFGKILKSDFGPTVKT